MELKLEWTRRIPLKNGAPGLIYTVDLEKLPWAPGVYIFGRTFGRNFEALYVGRAQRIRGRIRGQLADSDDCGQLFRLKADTDSD